ncbi:MAG: mechanosensitive ion channel [Gammaproteobacteria bacterium]|nr:mechanosensitive ion channel [Gammaproteobacteria bacterium]MDH3578646.1 mechanosensitive ion channel [Gammaproteobacteria bacterium]
MKIAHSTRLLLLLLSLLFAANSFAQETPDTAEPAVPDLRSLQTNWWAYFEGSRAEVEPRIEAYLKDTGVQIAKLAPQNQLIAQSILEAARDNLTAFLALLDDTELEQQELEPAAATYSIDALLKLAADARSARSAAAEEQLEVDREKRVLDGTTRHRDAVFDDYVDAPAGDERWLAGLRLLQARSAKAISTRRLALLTKRSERASAYAQAMATRADLARDRLATTAEEANLNALYKRVDTDKAAVENAEENLRAAQIAASGLDLNTAQGRSQQRLQQQRLTAAEISVTLAKATLARSEAQRWWTEMVLDAVPDIGALENQGLEWSEFVRSVEQLVPEWKRETGDELLAVQSVNRDGLDRASRRLLDQRLGTAQQTLTQIGELTAAIADLKLLMLVVDSTAAEYTGALKSWLSTISRSIKTAYIRVVGLADVTLFSVGETPVTGGDILRVLIILTVAYLLSRGIRHTIRRVGESESGGTQASLYTVGRLSHYTIIILGLVIALSSIGLDFSNLALVAGALSVGIGFGLQSIVNNFVSGLIILFEHSLRVGDYIELDTGLTGTVKAINVRSTLINTNDNIDIVVPNSEFVTTRLTNWTLGERVLRVRIPFGVAYGSDKETVKKAALEAAAEVPYTLTHMKGREPDVWLVEYGDSSLNFLLLVWVNRQGARRPTRTRSAYLWALETKLTEHGIEIPFPQRDLHLRSGWPDAQQPAATAPEPPSKTEGE